jgi:hypothetical protein
VPSPLRAIIPPIEPKPPPQPEPTVPPPQPPTPRPPIPPQPQPAPPHPPEPVPGGAADDRRSDWWRRGVRDRPGVCEEDAHVVGD